jgi:phenylpyruvate tautomerase PptA (4-oxalocrotonate tautomerase family)
VRRRRRCEWRDRCAGERQRHQPHLAVDIRLADTLQIAERGERAAEKAAMAAEVLATALAKARNQDPDAVKTVFSEVFKQFESPSAYEPARFVAGMKKAESAVR